MNIVYKWAPIQKLFCPQRITFICMINGSEVDTEVAKLRSLARKFYWAQRLRLICRKVEFAVVHIAFILNFFALIYSCSFCFAFFSLILSHKYEQCFGLCIRKSVCLDKYIDRYRYIGCCPLVCGCWMYGVLWLMPVLVFVYINFHSIVVAVECTWLLSSLFQWSKR